MLSKIINRFNNYLNRPNFKSEKTYHYDQYTSLILLDDGRPNNMVYFSCVPINMNNDKK
mgnify:CR=1 FL=1